MGTAPLERHGGTARLLRMLLEPHQYAAHDGRHRHDYDPRIYIQRRRQRELAVITELQEIVLYERIYFGIESRADQYA